MTSHATHLKTPPVFSVSDLAARVISAAQKTAVLNRQLRQHLEELSALLSQTQRQLLASQEQILISREAVCRCNGLADGFN